MAFDKKPSTWLGAGYAVDTDNHCIKFNTNDAASNKLLTELTDAEANATTGDVRKVIFALMEALWAAWSAIATADRPTKMTLYKTTLPTGSDLKHTYTNVLTNSVTSQEVADEPT